MFNYRNTVVALMATAAAFVAAPAMAQTEDSFTGPYVAAVGGWDRTQVNDGHQDAFLYGGQAGYDLSAGNVRFGPEVEVTGSTQKGCNSTSDSPFCANADRDFYAGGRVGYVVTPKAMVYAMAGYTNARYTDTPGRIGSTTSEDHNLSGGRVGAGAEYAVSKNVFVKTEYRYSNYSDSFARNQVIGGVGFRF